MVVPQRVGGYTVRTTGHNQSGGTRGYAPLAMDGFRCGPGQHVGRVVVSCSLAIAVSCHADAHRPASPTVGVTTSEPGVSINCIQGTLYPGPVPPAGYSVVLGVVALPTGTALQTVASGEADPRYRLFAKDGLFLRVESTFDLVVPAEWRDRLGIGWGSPGSPASHVRIPACKRTEFQTAAWVVYPGGFWVRDPACVTLVVQRGSQKRQVRIGVGAPCQGQSPPPQPSSS